VRIEKINKEKIVDVGCGFQHTLFVTGNFHMIKKQGIFMPVERLRIIKYSLKNTLWLTKLSKKLSSHRPYYRGIKYEKPQED